MERDLEAAKDSVDRQDQFPGSIEDTSHEQNQSTRPVSIASTRRSPAVNLPRQDGIDSNSTNGPMPEWRAGHVQRAGTMNAQTIGLNHSVVGEDQGTAEWLLDHSKDDIFSLREVRSLKETIESLSKFTGWKNEPPTATSEREVTITLSLAALNRMRMRRLQIQLCNRIMNMHYHEELSDDWERLLVQYISATRDNDYIRTCVERGQNDPFLISSTRKVDAAILTSQLRAIPSGKREQELVAHSVMGLEHFNFVPPLEKVATAIGGTRKKMTRKQWTEEFLKRVVLSIVAGAFLVVPMWVMISLNSQRASLIITTAFVFLGGIAASRALDSLKDVVATTAAYAAILVVFVGTSTATTPSSSQFTTAFADRL